jgi:hypothetical protein
VNWRQTIAAALLIALVSAAAVWFLEDFQRRQWRTLMAEEWGKWISQLPTTGPE